MEINSYIYSAEIPKKCKTFNVLAVDSRAQPNWKIEKKGNTTHLNYFGNSVHFMDYARIKIYIY